ncbi:MAG: hypothetical protein GY874_09720 [Desulfobacteraceae bacterium]|nr:hypothetical protein [Desulfobacteraceae bacterium]
MKKKKEFKSKTIWQFTAWAACRSAKPVSANAIQWIPALVVVGVLLLFGMTAQASDFLLETGDNWIKGQGLNVNLGDVLTHLAQRTGFTIYMDEKLAQATVSFDICAPLDSEKAIRQIVKPHNYAMVFARVPGKKDIQIQQVKVFEKSNTPSSYIVLTGSSAAPRSSASYARETSSASGGKSKLGATIAGPAAARKIIKPPVQITKSSLGFTGFRYKSKYPAPDYRPSSTAMAKSYSKYRQEGIALKARSENNKFYNGRISAERNKNWYRFQRTALIQETIKESKE